MAGIRSRNTRPELRVRRALHERGFRFRLHRKDVPGSPDLVFPKYRAAVFVHGCYWHGHECSLFRLPATNVEFWTSKIAKNRERDITVAAELLKQRWRRLVIWECAFRGRGRIGEALAIDTAAEFILGSGSAGEVRGVL